MRENSRTSNSIKNSISSLVSNITAIIIGFVAQAIFIRILNAEYLGLNGLFTNILTMLSFFELGIGNAIVFYMYKPLAENNREQIKTLMAFYKKTYRIIAFVVLFVGSLLLPFIKFLVNEVTVDINIYIIYCLFLLSTVTSYLMVYKRNMIYADQKNYISNMVHCLYLLVLNISQLIILYFTKNYYLYLIVKIICQLLENFIITILVDKMYPYLNEKNIYPIDNITEKNIFSKVKALVFHKIGYIIINGTDNIIISKFFGLFTVGVYSNYYLVTNAVYTMFSQVIGSLTASVGNLLISQDKEKSFVIFKKVRFINFIISCFCATSVLNLMQPFIKIWVGEQYLLSYSVLCVIVFNLFQKLQRCSYNTFKDSAGIWEDDKHIPIIESCLNIMFSVICLKIFGLAGVFIGTIISGIALWGYSYPKFVYNRIFNRNYKNYCKETLGYVLLFLVIAIISGSIISFVEVNNLLLQLVINLLINTIINLLMVYIVFRKTGNYKYFKSLFSKVCSKFLYRKI